MFHVYSSIDKVEDEFNTSYENKFEINDEASLIEAVSHDYVCARYKDNKRSNANFICSDCITMDLDNDHSDNPVEWIKHDRFASSFRNVKFAIHYSRNNMKTKNGKSARPKFHVLFPINEITDANEYSDMKRKIFAIFPYFDAKALDAGRFFYGTSNPEVKCFSGTMTINTLLADIPTQAVSGITVSQKSIPEGDANTSMQNTALCQRNAPDSKDFYDYEAVNPDFEYYCEDSIPNDWLFDDSQAQAQNTINQARTILEGERNTTMHKIACKLITQYGNTEGAYNSFIQASKHCVSPLESGELQAIWNGAVRSYENNVKTDENYIAPALFNLHAKLKPSDYSDIGQAKILAREYQDRLRYCELGTFLVYDNGCWHESDIQAQGVAQDLTDRQLEEANCIINTFKAEIQYNGAQNIIDNAKKPCTDNLLNQNQRFSIDKLNRAEDYKKFVMQRRDMRFINSVLAAVKSMITVKADDLDSNEFDLNTPSGTYDLRLGLHGSRKHNPNDLITKITAVSPSDNGMDIWLDFLRTIFQDDSELINYVQETIGLAAVGKVYCENLVIALGNGNNGKSTFYNVIARVLGDYSGTISSDSLTAGYRGNSGAERAEMKGKRIIIASELEEGKRLNTATLKQLCSTDKIHAEEKYKAPFDFTPSHSLILYTNYRPEISANDAGTWRRIVIIPFKAQISSSQDIKNYSDYLFKKAGSAILKWIIEGACNVIHKNFKLSPPDIVLNEISSYRDDNDWFSDFIEQCCELGADYSVNSKELYDAYRNYCHVHDLNIHSTNDFYSALGNVKCTRFTEKRVRMVRGVKLLCANPPLMI